MTETADPGLFEQCNADQILRRLLLRKDHRKKKEVIWSPRAPVPDAEPEKEQDYEDEEETEIKKAGTDFSSETGLC